MIEMENYYMKSIKTKQDPAPSFLRLPKYIYQATIAIEDKDFYTHGGVSFIGGILRAAKYFLKRITR
jgi:membrane carboxypeptidase/penicillin-binding protein